MKRYGILKGISVYDDLHCEGSQIPLMFIMIYIKIASANPVKVIVYHKDVFPGGFDGPYNIILKS